MGAGKENLRSPQFRADVINVCPDTVALTQAFPRQRTIASARPRSTSTLPYSTRLTTPFTTSPMRSLYSSYCRSRSASRTFCTMTCLAVWVAIRPKSMGGRTSEIRSPIRASGLRPKASDNRISVAGFSTSSTTSSNRNRPMLPVLRSISARISFSMPYFERAAFWIASSIASTTISASIAFSRATASAICNSSRRLAPTTVCASAISFFSSSRCLGSNHRSAPVWRGRWSQMECRTLSRCHRCRLQQFVPGPHPGPASGRRSGAGH